MITTVVGSYPALPKDPSWLIDKIGNFLGIYDKYKPAIALAVNDQIKAGINIISDGQVRGDMIETFAKKIPGMAVENKTPKIIGKINPPPYSLGASDLKYAIKIARKISEDMNRDKKPEISEREFKGVKGIVTGPTTLIYSCRMEGFYNKKEDAILDLAYVLKNEVEYLEDAGAFMIQIDEPFLSTGVVDIDTARKAIKIMTKNLSIPVSLHVCGNIGEVFDELLRFNIDLIDCEFAGIPQNLHVLENSDLKGKKIGFGCIDTKTDEIESLKTVSDLIKEGIKIVGKENMIIDPDCGMRMRSKDAAFSKLKVMVEASECLS
ncbi:MAG: methionine synthase [Euryarchaeota archaeon]|nr:methionine synthase [Euryarchaeota archaeon]